MYIWVVFLCTREQHMRVGILAFPDQITNKDIRREELGWNEFIRPLVSFEQLHNIQDIQYQWDDTSLELWFVFSYYLFPFSQDVISLHPFNIKIKFSMMNWPSKFAWMNSYFLNQAKRSQKILEASWWQLCLTVKVPINLPLCTKSFVFCSFITPKHPPSNKIWMKHHCPQKLSY